MQPTATKLIPEFRNKPKKEKLRKFNLLLVENKRICGQLMKIYKFQTATII